VLKAAGYDYIELAVGTVKPKELDWDGLETLLAQLAEAGLPCDAWNCLLPGELKVTGPDVDLQAVSDYIDLAFIRISKLGGRIIVFGSGGARRIPEGWPRDEAEAQLRAFLRLAASHAADHNLGIAIEPLRSAESNVINTVAEGLEYVRAVQSCRVQVLMDYYHLVEEGESLEVVQQAGNSLVHVHVATPGSRKAPGLEEYDFVPLMRALKESDYKGRISIEGGWNDLAAEAARALEVLKAAEQAAS
jgi:sugar phosphate isomerase/epimerase